MTRHALVSLLAIAAATPAFAADPPSLADQKAQIDIDQIRAGIATDRLKSQAELLAAIKGTTPGAATAEKIETSAEALLLTRRLYREAAGKLADAVRFPSGGRPIVMIGDSAPSVAEWYAFDAAAKRLRQNLRTAADQWTTASRPARRSHLALRSNLMSQEFAAGALGGVGADPISSIALGIDAVTSIASLFKYDTAVTAAALPFDDNGMDAVVTETLATRGFPMPAGSRFEIPGPPRRVEAAFREMDPDLKAARHAYGEYLQKISAIDKAENIPPAVAVAGKSLETALSDYDAASKSLYTPVSGLLPATLLDREGDIARDPNRPIVYVRRHAAALTTTTSKNFFTSLSSKVPIFVSASAEVAFVVGYGGRFVPGGVVCSVSRVRLTDAATARPDCQGSGPAADGVTVPSAAGAAHAN
jgi:hypothetical protein